MIKDLKYTLDNQSNSIATEPVIDYQHEIIFHKLPFVEAKKPKFTFALLTIWN